MCNLFEGLEFSKTSYDINKFKIPKTYLKPNSENAKLFNKLLQYCRKNEYRELKLTEKGTITRKGLILPAYNYSWCKLGCELIIINERCYRIQFRAEPPKDSHDNLITGTKAYARFKAICLQNFGIDLNSYAITNGELINETIEKVPIKLGKGAMLDVTYKNVHHADFHSSFPAGLKNAYPEFAPVVNFLYENRKEVPEYKHILNLSIGYMHSKLCNYKLAHLAKAAIEDNNKRVHLLAAELIINGRLPLLYNTDGIWYTGDVFSNEDEGTDCGQWSNDHVNCQLRIKSEGAYEFIENGQYYPVMRGISPLDKVKPRSEWKWGDIYVGSILTFSFSYIGIIIAGGDNYGEES